MSEIGKRYRKGELRDWDALVEIATKHGIARKHIPQKWTLNNEKRLYMWIGHAVVQAELALKKLGRRKGSIELKTRQSSPTADTLRKRKDTADIFAAGISDKEWNRRYDRRQATRRKKLPGK
jgi:hypothetical protein